MKKIIRSYFLIRKKQFDEAIDESLNKTCPELRELPFSQRKWQTASMKTSIVSQILSEDYPLDRWLPKWFPRSFRYRALMELHNEFYEQYVFFVENR